MNEIDPKQAHSKAPSILYLFPVLQNRSAQSYLLHAPQVGTCYRSGMVTTGPRSCTLTARVAPNQPEPAAVHI